MRRKLWQPVVLKYEGEGFAFNTNQPLRETYKKRFNFSFTTGENYFSDLFIFAKIFFQLFAVLTLSLFSSETFPSFFYVRIKSFSYKISELWRFGRNLLLSISYTVKALHGRVRHRRERKKKAAQNFIINYRLFMGIFVKIKFYSIST